MTPFDGTALLVMLLAFYPIVSGSELARARLERPEYFAGGALIGSKGDKLQLPDGRVFDLIQNAGGLPGTQRWQVIEPGPSIADPWPLEPGPLTPIDLGAFGPPAPASTDFEQLVAGALTELGASDTVLASAATTLAASAAAGAAAVGSTTELDDAEQAVEEISRARSADEIAEILNQSDGMSGAIDVTDADYDVPPPTADLPDEPGLPGYPGEDGTSDEPGRENPRHPGQDRDDDDTQRRP